LSSATSREQIALAAFEGVVLGLVEGHDSLGRLGVKTGARVLATGGGSSSPAYLQVLADSLGRGVHTVAAPQPVAKGAAIQVAAILGDVPISQVREAWTPSTTLAADPRDTGTDIRDRYRTISAWTGLES
jgi:xylulokinase